MLGEQEKDLYGDWLRTEEWWQPVSLASQSCDDVVSLL